MAIESAPRPRAVYALLLALGLLAAAVAGSTIGYISYEYATRIELREPVPVEREHSALPSLTLPG